jgi:hypothetical protein
VTLPPMPIQSHSPPIESLFIAIYCFRTGQSITALRLRIENPFPHPQSLVILITSREPEWCNTPSVSYEEDNPTRRPGGCYPVRRSIGACRDILCNVAFFGSGSCARLLRHGFECPYKPGRRALSWVYALGNGRSPVQRIRLRHGDGPSGRSNRQSNQNQGKRSRIPGRGRSASCSAGVHSAGSLIPEPRCLTTRQIPALPSLQNLKISQQSSN